MQNALGFAQMHAAINMNDASITRPSLLLRIFWQTTIDERDGKEVAKLLGLSVGAVYVGKSRVIARLKKEIQSGDAEGVTPPEFFV